MISSPLLLSIDASLRSKVLKDPQGRPVLPGLLEAVFPAQQAAQARQDPPVQRDPLERPDPQVLQAAQDRQDLQERRARQDSQGPQDRRVKPALQDPQDSQGQQDRPGRQAPQE